MLSIRYNNHVKSWRNSKIFWKNNKLFINKYDWEGTNFLSEKDDWKQFEKNNGTIALNVLYAK